MGISDDKPEGHMARTSKQIAFMLLAMYAIYLTGVLIGALTEASTNGMWFDLFKSGFLLLGGALTTIIGYYFGSRGVQEAEAKAATALHEAEKAREEAEKERRRASEIEESMTPTYDETSLAGPEEEVNP